MGSGGELHVEALLQRLQPAQRHPDAGVGLAGGNRLQQHVRRVAEVNELHVEIVFTEDLLLLRDGNRRQAHRAFVNRQLDFVRLRQAQGRVFLTARHGRHIVSPKGQRGPGQRKAAGQA